MKREDAVMTRRFPARILDARIGALALLIAWSLVASGCSKSSSGNQSSQGPSPAATASAAVATNDLMAKLPVYPGRTVATQPQTVVISGKHVVSQVYTTPDSFDKVHTWYQGALPSNSETSHQTSPNEESAVFTLSGGTTQQTVSILKTGGVEVVNITLTTTSE